MKIPTIALWVCLAAVIYITFASQFHLWPLR